MQPDFRGLAIVFNAKVEQGANGLKFNINLQPTSFQITSIGQARQSDDLPAPFVSLMGTVLDIQGDGRNALACFLEYIVLSGKKDSLNLLNEAYSPLGLTLIHYDKDDPLLPQDLKEYDCVLATLRETIRGREVKPAVAVPGFYGA